MRSSSNQTLRSTACADAQVSSIAPSAAGSASQQDHAKTLLTVVWRSPKRDLEIAALVGKGRWFRTIPVADVGEAVSRSPALSTVGTETSFACVEYETRDTRRAALPNASEGDA